MVVDVTSSTTDSTWEQGLCFIILYIPCTSLQNFRWLWIRSHHWMNMKDGLFWVGSSGRYHREGRTLSISTKTGKHIPARARGQSGYSAGHDVGEQRSSDSRRPGGLRESSVLFPGIEEPQKYFQGGEWHTPALLWDDFLGHCAKEGLGRHGVSRADQWNFTANYSSEIQ